MLKNFLASKLFLFFIIILILVLVFLVAIKNNFFINRTDISNWKTHSSDWHGFRIKFPPEWSLKVNNQDGPNLTGIQISHGCELVVGEEKGNIPMMAFAPCYVLSIKIIDLAEEILAKDYVKKYIITSENKISFEKENSIIINKNIGYELYGVLEPGYGNVERIYIIHNKKVITFDFLVASTKASRFIDSPLENNPIAHQIINTIEFTK